MVKRNQESDNEHEDQSPNKRHRIEDEEDGDDLTKKKINKPGKAAECGIIKKIYVEEFMCHKKLSINLCDNVNFVHGQNGSGKSAILAALQICLGAKANRTHRARNLKDLVRKEDGATQARVRVTLLNCGPDAFQHDIYGDEITIERLISLAGSGGGYKLLDRSLKCRSTKKGDLTDLLDQLNIQVSVHVRKMFNFVGRIELITAAFLFVNTGRQPCSYPRPRRSEEIFDRKGRGQVQLFFESY